jgi:hypothetical protein
MPSNQAICTAVYICTTIVCFTDRGPPEAYKKDERSAQGALANLVLPWSTQWSKLVLVGLFELGLYSVMPYSHMPEHRWPRRVTFLTTTFVLLEDSRPGFGEWRLGPLFYMLHKSCVLNLLGCALVVSFNVLNCPRPSPSPINTSLRNCLCSGLLTPSSGPRSQSSTALRGPLCAQG